MRVLVVSAHPDDEVIGAGGTLARHAAMGDEVSWCVVTEGYEPEWSKHQIAEARAQAEACAKVLGFAQSFFLGFPTVRLNTVAYGDLSTALQKVVDSVKPETVYIPPICDINEDHRIVHKCMLVATRPLPACPVRKLLAYEIVPTSHFGTPFGPLSFAPNVFVDISKFIAEKVQALSCYRNELRAAPHPRSVEGVRLAAAACGLSFGVPFGEAFYLIRQIER